MLSSPLALVFSALESMLLCAVLRLSSATWSLTLDFFSGKKCSHIVLVFWMCAFCNSSSLVYTKLAFEGGALSELASNECHIRDKTAPAELVWHSLECLGGTESL